MGSGAPELAVRHNSKTMSLARGSPSRIPKATMRYKARPGSEASATRDFFVARFRDAVEACSARVQEEGKRGP